MEIKIVRFTLCCRSISVLFDVPNAEMHFYKYTFKFSTVIEGIKQN